MKRLRWIVLGLMLAGAGAVIANVIVAQRAKIAALERKAEADAAEAIGLRAAVVQKQSEIAGRVEQNYHLNIAVTQLQSDLRRIGALKPKVIETIKWKTEAIPVPGNVIHTWPTELPEGCPPLPDFQFRVDGASAKVVTKKGNLFATGTVELFRVKPLPEVPLGTSPWSTDSVDIQIDEPEPVAGRRWRPVVGLSGVLTSDAQMGLVAHYGLQGRRWTWLIGAGAVQAPEIDLDVSIDGTALVQVTALRRFGK